jgi:hemerythrin superfamily protein
LIKADHRTVDDLFKKIEGAKESDKRRQLFKDVFKELSIHTDLEEQALYPVLEKLRDVRSLISKSFDDHQKVKDLLAEIDGMDSDADSWLAKFKELKTNVLEHVKEEEEQILPTSEKELDENARQDLANSLIETKERLLAAWGRSAPADLGAKLTEAEKPAAETKARDVGA